MFNFVPVPVVFEVADKEELQDTRNRCNCQKEREEEGKKLFDSFRSGPLDWRLSFSLQSKRECFEARRCALYVSGSGKYGADEPLLSVLCKMPIPDNPRRRKRATATENPGNPDNPDQMNFIFVCDAEPGADSHQQVVVPYLGYPKMKSERKPHRFDLSVESGTMQLFVEGELRLRRKLRRSDLHNVHLYTGPGTVFKFRCFHSKA